MTPATALMLSFSLSMDAFAAASSKGTALRQPCVKEIFKIGAVFALCEAVTPLLGWILGLAFASVVTSLDHWIAFLLLLVVGGRMILHSYQGGHPYRAPLTLTVAVLVTVALATSIDGIAVGVTLAFVQANILEFLALIGTVTFLVACYDASLGLAVGRVFGRWAELIGGIGLMAIGSKILVKHTLLA